MFYLGSGSDPSREVSRGCFLNSWLAWSLRVTKLTIPGGELLYVTFAEITTHPQITCKTLIIDFDISGCLNSPHQRAQLNARDDNAG